MREPLDIAILGELLGLLAHDLRNPLSALHSNLGYLASIVPATDTDSREAVTDGLVSCDGLAHIIDNIDLLGQTMRGTQWQEGSILDVAAVVTDVVATCRSMAASHGVELDLTLGPGDRPMSRGPRELIARALSNLIRNSIQHTSSGGRVRVRLRMDDTSVAIVVEDLGGALEGPALTNAFTAAGQVGSKTVPNGRYSRGLGLYSAALAAAAAHATVRAVALEGGSNTFELVLSLQTPG